MDAGLLAQCLTIADAQYINDSSLSYVVVADGACRPTSSMFQAPSMFEALLGSRQGERRPCRQGASSTAEEPGLPPSEIPDERGPQSKHPGPVLGSLAMEAPQCHCRDPSVIHSQGLGAWPAFLFYLESLIIAFIFLLQQISVPYFGFVYPPLKWDYIGIYPV